SDEAQPQRVARSVDAGDLDRQLQQAVTRNLDHDAVLLAVAEGPGSVRHCRRAGHAQPAEADVDDSDRMVTDPGSKRNRPAPVATTLDTGIADELPADHSSLPSLCENATFGPGGGHICSIDEHRLRELHRRTGLPPCA